MLVQATFWFVVWVPVQGTEEHTYVLPFGVQRGMSQK